MAKKPAAPAVADPAKSAAAELADEIGARLTSARSQKSDVEADLREALFATRPRLSRQILSTTAPSAPPKDSDELATSIGTEANDDFATEVINAFMPPNAPWAGSEAGEGVQDAAWDAVKNEAAKQDAAIFRGIRASNFDAELSTSLVPNAGIGTHAMWIGNRTAHEPVLCQDVPLRELEINVGPYGGIDDRFIVRHVRGRNVPGLFPGKAFTAEKKRKIDNGADDWFECRWAYWRDWREANDVVWQWATQVDGEVIDSGQYKGEGSCPLLVGRFSPDSLYAWGNGPTLDCLPYLRIHNALAGATQEQAGIIIRPPFAYPDDGVMNFDQGIEDGRAYPKRPGTKGEIEPLYFQGNADLGFFTIDKLEKTIRRKHFADYPDQPGKTPPSATQWLDEMVKSQRRIGTPGQKYWREFPAEAFLRFRYLLTARGALGPLSAEGRSIATRPRNPATKAQDNQELQTSSQVMGIIKSFFPMTSQAAIDELATIKNIVEKAGDKIIVLRDKATVEKFVASILQGAGNALGGGAGGPEQGQPTT